MQRFVELVSTLAASSSIKEKTAALLCYFSAAEEKDKLWVIALFSGRRPKRVISTKQLKLCCLQVTGISEWLFDESYHTVGDLAETIALLLPEPVTGQTLYPLHHYIDKLRALANATEEEKTQFLLECWKSFNRMEKFVFNKLITGGFRIGVSQKMMLQALALYSGLSNSVIAHRLSGNWDPSSITLHDLLNEDFLQRDISKPYPFYLAYALEQDPGELGQPADWQAEWKWDGIRGQLIKRDHTLFLWSRGEELITEKFPEYQELLPLMPDGTVLDGEILAFNNGRPLPFSSLQTRITRKHLSKKQQQAAPVVFTVYDLLELKGQDLRNTTLSYRREQLENMIQSNQHEAWRISERIHFESWVDLQQLRQEARVFGAEGLMLKRVEGYYKEGRKKGDWWKWKIDPFTIDCVLLYARKGHGRRSNLYTDYSFAVRDADKWVVVANAYSGLTDKEIAAVDAFVKKQSVEKFGPVRTVPPLLVFEIAFEGIAASNRHKSGIALRFPRIHRWRHDKPVTEANSLDDLKQLLAQYEADGE